LPTLKTSFVGLTLPSPLIAGSAAITKDLDQMRRAEDAGAGAVIMKGFSDIEAMRKSPAPRYRVIEHEMADRDAFTFYSYEQASHFDIHDYAAEVARTVEALSIPVIPNIDCQCVESWLEATRIVAEAGPAAIEANVSCPHGSIAFSGQDVERRILEVVEELRRAIDLPLIIKLTPQLTSPMSFVKAIEEIGAEGVTMFNRFTGLEVDVETGRPVMHGGYAGHGGPWARNFVLRWVNTVSPGTDLQISASGGVSEAEHALAYIMAGAQTVQVCTGIYLEGFEILTRLNAQLLEFMEARGLETLDEIRGELTERITPLDQVDRRHLVVADIQPRGTAPCRWECPINEDAQGYLNLIAEGKYDHALRLIKQNHPFPGVLGRCCHHPCETACTRGEVDDPISIAAMKRFAADHGGRYLPETPEPPPWRDERVAIVGAGPGGLTAAYRLALMGYRSTVFERLPVAGGMLAVGIPEYRLPRDVVRHEIGEIERLGVEIRTGVSVGRDVSLDDLREQGYSAILLAVGGHRQRKLGIPGEQLEGVIDGVRLLREHALGEPVALGEHVVVIGGGDVAVDSARVSIRLIDRVTLAYRRRFEDMPARREEIEEALEEGVELVDQLQPVEIINEGGRVAGVRFARTRMTQPGPDGRVGFEEIEGSSEIIECDTVVVSVGQIPDIGWLKSVQMSTAARPASWTSSPAATASRAQARSLRPWPPASARLSRSPASCRARRSRDPSLRWSAWSLSRSSARASRSCSRGVSGCRCVRRRNASRTSVRLRWGCRRSLAARRLCAAWTAAAAATAATASASARGGRLSAWTTLRASIPRSATVAVSATSSARSARSNSSSARSRRRRSYPGE
jgi:dihydroorotate dehydrogenase subfamily 1